MLRRVSFYEWIAIGVLVLGGVVWSVKLEGRVERTERELSTLRQQYAEDVRYIRERLDRALEGRQ